MRTSTRTRLAGPWLLCHHPRPACRLRLFCLPFAGGGSWIFRDWAASLPQAVEVWAFQLPGRERRIREDNFSQLDPLANAIVEALEPRCHDPFAIFGHSMGALVGFEVARRLRDRRRAEPTHLFASAHRAPHLPDAMPPIHHLPRAEFIEKLRDLNGTPAEVFENPELLDLVLPVVRADFTLCETYAFRDAPPLGCPISVYGGLHDEHVDREALELWRQHTTGPCTVQTFPGDHFFILSCRELVLRRLSEDLDSILQTLVL